MSDFLLVMYKGARFLIIDCFAGEPIAISLFVLCIIQIVLFVLMIALKKEEKMSEVKRFLAALGFDPEPYVDMIEDGDGTYVYYEDYEALRTQLAEAQKEVEMLKHNANEKLNLCRDHWQRGMQLNIKRAEQAEAENAALRERLQGIEDMVIWIANKK